MFSKILPELLEKNNMTLTDLARATNVPKTSLSAWIKGRSPRIEQIDIVARYFNVTIEYLMFGRNTKEMSPLLVYRTEINSGNYEIIIRKISDHSPSDMKI